MNGRSGVTHKFLILFLAMLFMALAAVVVWHHGGREERRTDESTAPDRLNPEREMATGGRQSPSPLESDPFKAQEDAELWRAIQEVFRVERVHHSGDPKWQERSFLRRDFRRVEGLVKELRREGFEGDALFNAVEERLIETYVPEAAKPVDRYRLYEQAMAGVDLEAMSPEERFEYVHRIRRDVFGDEMADTLFFEKEAFARYKLEETEIREDASLTEEEQRARIVAQRNALQVELASRGAYVSFADERRDELESKLMERYGEDLESMSAEERGAATWELYREELPPETVEKVERVLASQARKRAVFEVEAYQEESQAILNDPELSFEQRQEQLEELADRYPSGGF